MSNIDRKFAIQATSLSSRETYTEEDSILFLARDAALLPTLRYYQMECKRIGAVDEQLRAVDALIKRVKQFQQEHGIKVANVSSAELARLLI